MSPINPNQTFRVESSNFETQNVGSSIKNKTKSWTCEAFAKRSRKRVHMSFYRLGCFIQQHYIGVFILAVSVLCMFLFGLKDMTQEHDIQKMWIETGGRLQEELAYTEDFWGKYGYGSELQVIIQVKNEKLTNLLHPDALLEHLEILKKVKNMRINKYYSDWSLEDFCFKYDVPFIVSRDIYMQIKKLIPCVIMTPLDCFWEGSLIASTDTKYNEFSWTKDSPIEYLNYIKDFTFLQDDFNQSVKFMKKAGIHNGYLGKPCLNQNNQKCLKHQKRKEENLGLHLSKGCYGIAENYMHWPKEMIVSGLTTDSVGHRADALQSVIQIFDAPTFYKSALDNQHYNDELKMKLRSIEGGFTLEAAEHILRDWKIEYTKLINSELVKSSMKYSFLAFSTSSFTELVDEMTSLNKKNLIIAGSIVAAYAFVSLKRWTKGVYSYGSVGLVGVILGCLSVASGLGLSSIAKMKLTAVSAQVLPFLTIGFGMDNMFLLVRTYIFVCDAGIEDKRIIGMCLGECGLSITINSVAIICGLLSTSVIQITTLQTFIYQAVFIMVVFWFAVIMIFSSILALDVERLKMKRYDLFCCLEVINDSDEEPPKCLENQYKNKVVNFKNQPFVVGNSFMSEKPNKTNITRSHRHFNVSQKMFQSGKKLQKLEPSSIEVLLKKFSITYFAQNYFGEWVTEIQVKIVVMFVCCIQLFIAGYGTAKVQQGLDLGEMVPRESPQHRFLSARQKYFSFYQVHVVTKGKLNGKIFDYSNNQGLLTEFYARIKKLSFVMGNNNDEEPTFWLPIYRNWLQGLENMFLDEWALGWINHSCMPQCEKASEEAKIAYTLLSTTFKDNFPFVQNFTPGILVKDDVIDASYFYCGLSFWYWNDMLGVHKSQIGLKPEPLKPSFTDSMASDICKFNPEFMAIPVQVGNLVKTEDYVTLIKEFRDLCDEFRVLGLPSYPMGDPFTYWEQFIYLKKYLCIALMITLSSLWIVLVLTFMNIRATFIVIFVVGLMFFELYGFIGLLGLQLNAMTTVILIMSIGVGVSNSVHTLTAFLNTPGDRHERVRGALEITMSSICDNYVSLFLMLVLLSTSPFDFVIRYFFRLLLCLQCTVMFNSLFVLPTILSFFGPCPEVQNRSIRPTLNPAYHIPISVEINTHYSSSTPSWKSIRQFYRRKTLTPIPEVSERSSSAGTEFSLDGITRTPTPFSPSRPCSSIEESCDEHFNNPVETTLSSFGSNHTDAWHHLPKLNNNENEAFNVVGINIPTKSNQFSQRSNEENRESNVHNSNRRFSFSKKKEKDLNDIQKTHNKKNVKSPSYDDENSYRVINVQSNTFSTSIKATFSFDIHTRCIDDGMARIE
ncbi:protein patched homolog 2 isoform X1 [Hydra vulgaris]|uniref:protein patched homolog 2 isoform X1 n=2 Tax=Hydra vulgaris TaxID=6087 RepID=UPI001F5ED486|nr:protein patched homolog 2 isoform X1 [Hydra vulgaris]